MFDGMSNFLTGFFFTSLDVISCLNSIDMYDFTSTIQQKVVPNSIQ